MKITIYCVGHLKEDYWLKAQAEYLKRLNGYASTTIVEVDDVSYKEGSPEAVENQVKIKECGKFLAKIKANDYVIALDLAGKDYDSVSFSKHLMDDFSKAGSSISFIIGGSLGLSTEAKQRANESICFSKMTFPHQMARIILLEQLYRAFRIEKHEPYHK